MAAPRLTRNVSSGSNAHIAVDKDGERFRRVARSERQRAAGGLVVAVRERGAGVGRGVVDRDRLRAGIRQRDGEDEGRRAAVPLGMTDVVDADRRLGVVVADRAQAGAVGDGGVGRRR